MRKLLIVLCTALLALAAFGCGGDDSSTGDASTDAAATKPTKEAASNAVSHSKQQRSSDGSSKQTPSSSVSKDSQGAAAKARGDGEAERRSSAGDPSKGKQPAGDHVQGTSAGTGPNAQQQADSPAAEAERTHREAEGGADGSPPPPGSNEH